MFRMTFVLSTTLFLIAGLPMGAAHAAVGDLLHIFQNPMPESGDDFGRSIATIGQNVLIGAPGDEADSGVVYMFDSTTGGLLQTFQNPTPAPGDRFGYSIVPVGDNRVAISAPSDDFGAKNGGVVHLFDLDGTLQQTFLNPTPKFDDWFGGSIDEFNGNVLIGCAKDDIDAWNSGAAYLFDSSTGDILQTYRHPDPAAFDHFGSSVATVGDRVILGTRLDDALAHDTGAAYLFDGLTGELEQTYYNPTPGSDDRLGSAIAAVGDNFVITAPRDDTGASNAGAAYLFDTSGNLLAELLNPSPGVNDNFGGFLATDEDRILIGSHNDDTGAVDAGAAYLFDDNGDLLQTFLNPTPEEDERFGTGLALMDDRVFIGAPNANADIPAAGAVYMFQAVPEPSTIASLLSLAVTAIAVGLWRKRRR